MHINKETLQKIAHLSRLEINPQQEEKLMQELSQILSWVEKLNELDTQNVEPLTNMTLEVNHLREDKTWEHLPHKKALLNAPHKDSDYFRVPKVIE